MIKVTTEEREFLIENIENAENILLSDDVDDILGPLDLFIATKGLDNNYELTDIGRMAERIYDNIYYNSY